MAPLGKPVNVVMCRVSFRPECERCEQRLLKGRGAQTPASLLAELDVLLELRRKPEWR